VYDTSRSDFSDATFKDRLVQVASRRPDYTAFSSPQFRFESPLDRYNRLKTEVKQFQEELDSLVKQSAASKADPVREVSDLINKDLAGLEKELGALLTDERLRPFMQPSAATAEAIVDADLTGRLLSELERAGKPGGKGDGKQKPAVAAAGSSQATYELYYAGSGSDKKEQLDLVQLDRRVALLEKSLGSITESSPAFPDVQTGLRVVSKKVELIDDAKLDAVSKRVKALRIELEALESQRAALKGAKASPHEDKVSQLYAMMSRWDKAAQVVPTVITRLQTLREIHEECATLVVRVQNVEKQQEAVDRLLKEDRAALDRLTESLATNAKLMQANVSTLDSRFTELAKRMDALQRSKR